MTTAAAAAAAAAPVTHIRLDGQGRAWIDGTTMKVVELVSAMTAYGWTAEDLSHQYPHLTLAQIHAALAYYYDHQPALDAELERIARDDAAERGATLDSPLRQRLRALRSLSEHSSLHGRAHFQRDHAGPLSAR